MKRHLISNPVCLLIVALALGTVSAGVLPEGFRLEPVVTGLTDPSAAVATPDGRLLIAERTTGDLRQIRQGRLDAAPLCHVDVETTGEAGLLGVALHPGFAGNGWAYLYYTDLAGGDNRVTRVTLSRQGCSAATSIVSGLGSGSGFERNGGALAFGADGKLYVAVGDMESPADAQVPTAMGGKVLRLNDDGSIPADNPTPGSAVFAMGLRDGLGLTAGLGGELYALDGGEAVDGSVDELNVVPAGGDLGWPTATGDSGGVFDDPVQSWTPPMGRRGLALYAAQAFPDAAADGLDSDHDRYGADGLPGTARVDENGKGTCVGSSIDGDACSSSGNCIPRAGELAYCLFEDDPDEYCFGNVPFGDDKCGANGTDEPDESYMGNLFLVDPTQDRIVRAVLDPADPLAMNVAGTFLNSAAMADCPTGWTAAATGPDGFLYVTATNGGGAGLGGLYRVIHDPAAGPREVSAPGSPFPLTLERLAGSDVALRWEDLRADVWQPRDNGTMPTAPEREFTVWVGQLGAFDSHAPLGGYDGIAGNAVNGALRETTLSLPDDSYVLVSGRGANLEGTLGQSSAGVERTGFAVTDLCQTIGYHDGVSGGGTALLWTCGQDFRLADETGRMRSLYEFRGTPILLDLSAVWCGPCNSEADILESLHKAFVDRGVTVLTVLMDDEVNSGTSPEGRPSVGDCRHWGDRSTVDHTFPCMADSTTSGQLNAWPMYGTGYLPTNVVMDRGMRVTYTDGGYNAQAIYNRLVAMTSVSYTCLP